MKRKKPLFMLGYIAFTVSAFLCCFYWTFPADALAQRLVFELQRRSGGAWRAEYKDASTFRLSGLQFENVKIKYTDLREPLASPQIVAMDALRARVRILPLMLRRWSLQTQVRLHEGLLAATFTAHGSSREVEAEADQIDFNQPPLLATLLGIPVGGKLNGTLEAAWDVEAKQANGEFEMVIDTGSVGPGSVAGFTLPRVGLGQVTATGTLKDGQFRLEQFKQKGGNLSLQAKGHGTLHQQIARSQLDMCLRVRADASFLDSNPKIKGVLQLAEVQMKKDPEGYLNIPVTGPATALQLGHGLCH